MRKAIMGIDLGTTNSCVAIPEENGDIQVVEDNFGRYTFPSVVYKDSEGKYEVGLRAKQKMGTNPPPIAFIKHYMGKDHKVKLGDEELTPEEVSAKILGYLQSLVKEHLKDEITQAVITIPARFELAGQQATVKAAQIAGLEVLETLPEPVAAALAFGLQEAKDDLIIFCYDLGGGTFDATVMVKDPVEGIKVLAFDGDPDLGGYNFDKAISQWILKKLKAKGYKLDLNFDDPADQVRFQKLMRLAEKAKIALSKGSVYAIEEEDVFNDHQGEPVEIKMELARAEYEEMIRPMVKRTIEISQRAIDKAKLKEEQKIGVVIMVGGSSKIPLTQSMLAEHLEIKPELTDPDRIVARGAAVKASMLVGSRVEGINFLAEIPKKTTLESFDIHARVSLENAAGVPVYLDREDGGYSTSVSTDDAGEFHIHEIELEEDETNGFELVIGNRAAPLVTHNFEVEHDIDTKVVDPNTVFLTQPIRIMSAVGFSTIFEEGEVLPVNKTVTLRTQFDGQREGKYNVYNEHQNLGEVMLRDMPDNLDKGTEVVVRIAIDKELNISTTATLVKTGQFIEMNFTVPRPKLPSLDALKVQFDRLKKEANEAIETINDPFAKMENKGTVARLIKEIEEELASEPCSLPKLYRLCDEFEVLLIKISKIDVLEPPREVFLDNIEAAKTQAALAERKEPEKAKRAGFLDAIATVEKLGLKAYDAKNKEAWENANAQIDRILYEIRNLMGDNKDPMEHLTPEERAMVIKKGCIHRLMVLDGVISQDSSLSRFKQRVSALVDEANRIPVANAQEAISKGFSILAEIDKLEKEIKLASEKWLG